MSKLAYTPQLILSILKSTTTMLEKSGWLFNSKIQDFSKTLFLKKNRNIKKKIEDNKFVTSQNFKDQKHYKYKKKNS